MSLTTRTWTREEYYKMGEAGVFAPGERVELIEGEIVAMSPQNKPRARSITKANRTLVMTYGATHDVRVQLPLDLGEKSQPEPDFALVPLGVVEAAELHPTTADLVIEVSDSSLSFDRGEKASVFAKYSIHEYWVLDVRSQRLYVHLEPGPDAASPYGHVYRRVQLCTPEDSVTPTLLGQSVLVSSLL